MKKQILTFFALWGTIITTQCMITNPSFKPYTQVKNPEIQKSRDEKKCFKQHIKISKTSNDDRIRCFEYALKEITGFTGNIIFYSKFENLHLNLPINDFFEQLSHPQPGCLAVYTDEQLTAKHFAIAIDGVSFKSKFGAINGIWRHRLFDVFSNYENNVYFFKLKQKYEDNQKDLLHDLEEFSLKQMQLIRDIRALKSFQQQQKEQQRKALISSVYMGSVLLMGLAIINKSLIEPNLYKSHQ